MVDRFPSDPSPRPADSDSLAYRPLAPMAVAAFVLSIIAAVLVIGLVIAARISNRAILSWWVLFPAIIGLALAFFARLQIRNSEGTRVGMGLANFAWWSSLLVCLLYGSYHAATDVAVNQQAKTICDEYIRSVLDNQPEKAFRLTLEPAQQKAMPPDDLASIRQRFAVELDVFQRSELSRLVKNWDKKVKVDYLGAKEAEQTPTGFKVPLGYRIASPEGEVELTLTAAGTDDPVTGSRGWKVVFQQSGTNQKEYRRTRLGRIFNELQANGLKYWQPLWKKVTDAGPAALEPKILVEGSPPPEAQRKILAQELLKPLGLSPFSRDPTRQQFPIVSMQNGKIVMVFTAFSNTATFGEGVPTPATVVVANEKLLQEVAKLSGENWEKQELFPVTETGSVLVDYAFDVELMQVDLRLKLPRDMPPERTMK